MKLNWRPGGGFGLWRGSGVVLVAHAGALCCFVAGCGPNARITLEQPMAPPSQRTIRLAGNWTYMEKSGGRTKCLLAFPLPGADDGPRDFIMYLDLPEGQTVALNPTDAAGGRGFLIQAVGERRGKTTFQSGSVKLSGILFKPGLRTAEINLVAEDGTRVTGKVVLQPSASELGTFEKRHAADVAMLTPSGEVVQASDETGKRAGGG